MRRARFQLPSYSKYYTVAIGIVLFVGVLSTAYTYKKVTSSVQESLLKHVSAVASALEPHYIATLSGDDADLTNPDYIVLKQRLQKIRELSHETRFIYLAGYRANDPFFFVDSEPQDSPDYSPPGQVYEEASQIFRSVFFTKQAVVEGIFSDRWGTWLTALAPIVSPENGEVVAIMGMDMDARQYYKTVYVYSALPAIATSFIILLIVVGFVIGKQERRFLEFKSELVSIASHEIRTPLAGIFWVAESLLRNHSDNLSPNQKDDIQLVKNNSQNLLMTVNDLLDLSVAENVKIGKVVKKEIVAVTLLQEIIKNFELSVREKNLKVELDSSLAPSVAIYTDIDRLKRMFNNLISNAIKYSKRDGKITIGCESRKRSFVFWIKDKGIGIPKTDQERIFKGFYRSENAKQVAQSGTGLGLLYVRQIAELHGGRVWCKSEENKGSIFFVELSKKR